MHLGQLDREVICPDNDIWVPAIFHKVIAISNGDESKPDVLAFLFPHQRSPHGRIEDFLVTVDEVEAMACIDLFADLDEVDESAMEDESTWENWKRLHQVRPNQSSRGDESE